MKKIFTSLLVSFFCLSLLAQGTLADYERAYSLQEKFRDKVFYSDVNPHWVNNTHSFWYIRNTPNGRIYTLVDADKKTQKILFDHNVLATELALQNENANISATALNLQSVEVNNSLDTIRFQYHQQQWIFSLKNNELTKGERRERQNRGGYWGSRNEDRDGRPTVSPDKKYSISVKEHNLYLKNVETGEEKPLTTDGTKDEYYAASVFWSPDARKVAATKVKAVETRKIYFVESSPKDQLQPKFHHRQYAKPGDELPFKQPCIFNIETGDAFFPTTELFDSQYSFWGYTWSKDSKTALFEYNQRGHQVYRVLEISAETGKVRTIIEETSETFVNYNRRFRRDLENGTEIIWMSERDNWNHLYLYDRNSGKVKQQITKGEWYVREVLHVDEKKREIIFSANGMNTNEDPYLIRYYRIRFDGKGLTDLTPAKGHHKATFSDDKKFLVDVYSMVDKAPVAVLRDARTGKIIMPLEKADISELEKTGWQAPETFSAKGRDGETDIWGIIVRPTNFDPTKKYPIIEYIYAGPGSHYVPKSFAAFNYNMTALAELGFIVIQIDGMGTSFRSKAFEEICFKNLKDAGFPDRIAWTKAAAEKYLYMDIENIGIFGASAGGQESMTGLLFYPDHYKAAYSSCGCHDNRMDKIWWNEQWMSYPIGEQYAESSNVVNAHLLKRPLMLVVGELDDNVDPASTMQVCNALIKANKDFELVVLPGDGHTMGGSYGEHKRFDFFVKHLLKVAPPAWDEIKK